MGTITVRAFIDNNSDGGFAGNILRAAGSVAIQNIADVAVFGRAVALAPFGFKDFFLAGSVFPFIAAGAGATLVFSVTYFAGTAGIAGAGAGIREAEFIAGFGAKPGVAPGTFDACAVGAGSFGVTKGGTIRRRRAVYALRRGGHGQE